MPGQGIVTIGDNQWGVELADTTDELIAGVAGRESINPGTGMLFTLPSRQTVTVTTAEMLFPIDVVFISDDAVIDIARDVQPGYEVTEDTPCDGFLEVNTGEAFSVEVGDTVVTEVISTGGFDTSQVVSLAIPVAALGFVCAIAGGMLGSTSSSSHSSEVRRLGGPRTEEERAKVHEEFYGTKELPARGKGLEERGESTEGRRLGEPKVEAERKEAHERKYGTVELPERGKGMGHPSSEEKATFPPEARKDITFCKHMWELEKTMGRSLTREEVAEKWEAWKKLRYRPKTEEERRLSHSLKYGTEELPERGKGLESRHSQEEEETRFIGACKIVNGLCHTHGYPVSKVVKCPESPLTDEEWAAAWELAETAYPEGMSNPWVNGWWPETLEEAEKTARAYEWKMKDAVRMFREKQAKAMENYERGADKAIYNYRRYVIAEYETGKEIGVVPGPAEHHSMWMTPEQRKECEKEAGAVSCRWAEEFVRPGKFEEVKRAARVFYSKMKEAVGIA